MANLHRDILIGATGWNHKAWTGSYYPQDLPKDWRLSFYANEFNTVLVPERDWINKPNDDVAQWIDDTHDEFVFFFQLSLSAALTHDINQQLAPLNRHQNQVGGVLINVPAAASEDDLSKISAQLPSNLPISLELSNSALSEANIQRITRQLGATSSWHKNKQSTGQASSEKQQLGVLDTKIKHSHKQLKTYFEQFNIISRNSGQSALFLSGNPPNMTSLRDIKMIKELIMG